MAHSDTDCDMFLVCNLLDCNTNFDLISRGVILYSGLDTCGKEKKSHIFGAIFINISRDTFAAVSYCFIVFGDIFFTENKHLFQEGCASIY